MSKWTDGLVDGWLVGGEGVVRRQVKGCVGR